MSPWGVITPTFTRTHTHTRITDGFFFFKQLSHRQSFYVYWPCILAVYSLAQPLLLLPSLKHKIASNEHTSAKLMSGMMQVFCLFCTGLSDISCTDSFVGFWVRLIKRLNHRSETCSWFTAVLVNNCMSVKWLLDLTAWHFSPGCEPSAASAIRKRVIRDHRPTERWLLSFTRTSTTNWWTQIA